MSIATSILTLARSGATQRAWEAFVAAGLDQSDSDISCLTLKGRLLKDRARQAKGAERAALFAQAGAAYERAASLRPDSYPLINAAAMALFAGDRIRAELYASKTLHLIDSGEDPGETPYWREATRAEALLLLGRTTDAQASLQSAVQLAPKAWEDHAATIRQFAAILAQTHADAGWLDIVRPPPSLHFMGAMGVAPDDLAAAAAIRDAVARIGPGFAYGALAAGTDILVAEIAIEAGAELHVVLPSDSATFALSSVEPFGEAWLPRYHGLLEAAASVTIASEASDTSEAGIALADYLAMGMTARNAALFQANAVALRASPSGRRAAWDPWRVSRRKLVHISVDAAPIDGSSLKHGTLRFDLAIRDQANGEAITSYAVLTEAAAALNATGTLAAFDCSVDPESGDARRAAALLRQASPDFTIASRNAAFALLAEGRCAHFEPWGEMATIGGVTDVYAVRLRPPPEQDKGV